MRKNFKLKSSTLYKVKQKKSLINILREEIKKEIEKSKVRRKNYEHPETRTRK